MENDSSFKRRATQHEKEDLEQEVMCAQECFNYNAYSYGFKKQSKQTYVMLPKPIMDSQIHN